MIKSSEGINTSEMGWATDFFLALNVLLLSSEIKKNYKIKLYFLNIAIAYFFGGITHKYFGNKAQDGVGQIGAYIFATAGYLPLTIGHSLISNNKVMKSFLVCTQIIQKITAGLTMYHMKKVKSITDDAEPNDVMTKNEKKAVQFDYYYALLEGTLVILYSIVVFNYSYSNYKERKNINILLFCVFNIIGYILVYGGGMLSYLKIIPKSQKRENYNQLIFHKLVNVSMFYLYKYHK